MAFSWSFLYASLIVSGIVALYLIYFENHQVFAKEGPYVPSCAEIERLRRDLDELLDDTRLHTATLRLGFHVCVGGCDGCLEFDNPDNAGLSGRVEQLEPILKRSKLNISRADFWALASTVAIEKGVRLANEAKGCGPHGDNCPVPVPCFTYKWGRKDCPTSPELLSFAEMPSAHWMADQVFHYFREEFGFTKKETVALMGAHTLGGTFHNNSGFIGVWSPEGPTHFDNGLYTKMLDPTLTWENHDVGTDETGIRMQWNSHDPDIPDEAFNTSMMFNTDFEMLFNLTLDENGRSVTPMDPTCFLQDSCGKNGTAPKSDTFDLAFHYSLDINDFMRDFQAVYEKLIVHGNTGLVAQGGTCSCAESSFDLFKGYFRF